MWYYPEGVANILSQHRMITCSKWKINFSSDLFYKTGNVKDLTYDCVTSEGLKVQFVPSDQGLYVKDCSEYLGLNKSGCFFGTEITDNGTQGGELMSYAFSINKINNSTGIDTVEQSRARVSTRDRERANTVRRSSDNTMTYSAVTNGIKNSPITKQDVKMALEMLGRSKYALQGKTARHQPDAVNAEEQVVDLPPTIMEYYKNVELSIDILHVN